MRQSGRDRVSYYDNRKDQLENRYYMHINNIYQMLNELKGNMRYLLASNIVLSVMVIVLVIYITAVL